MDALASGLAVLVDAFAIFGGFLVAIWLRFNSGLIAVDSMPPRLMFMYGWGAGIATIIFLFIFRSLELYIRPQQGRFPGRIPRLIRAIGLGILITTALAFAIRPDDFPPFSRLTIALAAGFVLLLVLIERWLLFRLELFIARRGTNQKRILIIGTDTVAAHLKRGLESDPRLRSTVIGFIETNTGAAVPEISPNQICGQLEKLDEILDTHPADQIILSDSTIGHQRILEIILAAERNMITFNMVPDIFRIMTGSMDMQTVDDIPLLGVSRWPLDTFWNQMLKRCEDICGALLGLLFLAPLFGILAMLIRRSSPGPVFYRQKRCGENGKEFTIYKFRTMQSDAEKETGPVWAVENDPRRTALGSFLRRTNIDELPQLWNVLRGDMSLIGPRPERPHFVEKFKDDIDRYIWRHASKPGMTGWAQVNGLRGNTSIAERIKYDLYYLENWSLSLDFKILLRTFSAQKNAY
ncbi:MAG: undecaprenyl-phosphate glucose phosphotransferase [bacterium]|jgi:exopolysaccharide biosynthesis polyprenyl glycosylphosphotransferase